MEGTFNSARGNSSGEITFPEGIFAEAKKTLPDGRVAEGIWYCLLTNTSKSKKIAFENFSPDELFEGKQTYPNGKVEKGIFKEERLIQPEYIQSLEPVEHLGLGVNAIKVVALEGECIDKKLFGKGKATFTNGDVWKGEWKFGHFRQGKRILHDGTVEDGEFKANKLDGKGKRIYSHGYVEEGLFKDGNFIGPAPQSPPLKKAEG